MSEPDFDKRETQEARILGLLRARRATGATSAELNAIAFRYAAIVHTLRHKRGLDITTEKREGTELVRYILNEATAYDPKVGCSGHEERYYGKTCPICNPPPPFVPVKTEPKVEKKPDPQPNLL